MTIPKLITTRITLYHDGDLKTLRTAVILAFNFHLNGFLVEFFSAEVGKLPLGVAFLVPIFLHCIDSCAYLGSKSEIV